MTVAQSPASHGPVAEQYAIATTAAGIVDRSQMGRLEITGSDALDLLDRLSTNKLTGMEAGLVVGTVLTSNKGRIIDVLYVLQRPDGGLIVFTGPETRQTVADWIDFYTFTEDVSVRDVTGETAMLSVVGPGAGDALGRLGVESLPGRFSALWTEISGVNAGVLRTDLVGVPTYDLLMPVDEARRVWSAAVDSDTGITPVGLGTIELVRIERGIPASGSELTESYNPLEAGLLDLISFNKGCYIGQEVVARLDTYNKVQRQLVRLSWDATADLAAGTRLTAQGKRAGVITSVASGLGKGLGYVRKARATAGNRLAADSPGGAVTVDVEGPSGRFKS